MAIDVAAISYGRRIRIGKISSLSSLLVRFAVPVIVADFALLPMFHIGWMPWKPGYIILIIAVLIYLRTLPRERFAVVRPFFILATILMAGTAIGSAVFEYQTSVGPSTSTLRMLVVYGLIPMGILVGVADNRHDDRYILWLVLAFFAINIFTAAAAPSIEWLADFYHLSGLHDGEPYARGVRVPGILGNPNITAFMATILLMYLAVGFKFRTIKPAPVTVTAGVLSVVAIVVLMISRNQLLAVMLVIAGVLFYLPRPVIVKAGILLAVIVAGITLVVFSIDSDTQEKYLNIRLTEAFEARLAQSGFGGSGGIDSLLGETGVTRPFRSLGGAIDRWKGSVIFGTGLETAEGRPAPNYHNDWATVLASAGIIGLAAYAFLVILLGRLEWLLVIPFILPGMTNAFLFAPQHVVLVALLGGLVAGRKLKRRRTANESQVPVDRSPWPVLSRRRQMAVPVSESMGESE